MPACLGRLAGPRLALLPLQPKAKPINVGIAYVRADGSRLLQQFLAAVREDNVASPKRTKSPRKS